MKELLLTGYELLAVLIPFAALYAGMRRRGPAYRGAYPLAVLLAFAVYVCGALHCTGAGTLFDVVHWGLEIYPEDINLLPFSQQIDLTGYLLNIVLLVPFGMLAPLIWPRLRGFWQTAAAGACFSLLIELSQLLNGRHPDVDDLLLNALGAAVGWLAFRLLPCRLRKREAACPYAPALVAGALFLGRFLLFDELGAARLLYGF